MWIIAYWSTILLPRLLLLLLLLLFLLLSIDFIGEGEGEVGRDVEAFARGCVSGEREDACKEVVL
jgi:hypothetical protein